MSGNEECQAHQLHNSIINGRRLTCGPFCLPAVHRAFAATEGGWAIGEPAIHVTNVVISE